MTVRLSKWEAADYLNDQEDCDEHLRLAVESGNPKLVALALGDIAKAQKRLGLIAQETGLNKAGLYRSFTQTGNPSMENFFRVAHSLGYGVNLQPLTPAAMANYA